MNSIKNIILLKNLPSNLVEEAIVVLKENTRIHRYQLKELEENKKELEDGKKLSTVDRIYEKNDELKKEKSLPTKENNEYIIKEAEMLIKNYLDNLEKKSPKWKNNMKKLEKRYKNSIKLNFILSFTTLLSLIFLII